MDLVLVNEGKQIYLKRKNLRTICDLMENKKFRAIFDSIKNEEEMKALFLMLNMYKYIEDTYSKIAILENIIHDPVKRQKICSSGNSFYKSIEPPLYNKHRTIL